MDENGFASLSQRFWAHLLDNFLLGAISIALKLVGLRSLITEYVGLAIFFSYFILPEGIFGKTFGKNALNIEVLDEGMNSPGLIKSPIRNIIRVVEIIPTLYILGSISIISSSKNKRIGDYAGRKYVIKSSYKE